MRCYLAPIMIAAILPTFAWGQGALERPSATTTSDKAASVPRKLGVGVNPCAAYGVGFVKVEGTSTCVKVGGAIGISSGVGVR